MRPLSFLQLLVSIRHRSSSNVVNNFRSQYYRADLWYVLRLVHAGEEADLLVLTYVRQ